MAKKLNPYCFVLMPFAGEFQDIYEYAIVPAVTKLGLECRRADSFRGTGSILKDVIQAIYNAEIVIVDVSKANPNVFYELGISHALAKNVILISQDIEDVPFDIRQYRVIIYKPTLPKITQFQQELRNYIQAALENPTPSSPVLDSIPQLDKVPRSELELLEKKLQELQSLVASREAEIKTLRSGAPQSLDIAVLADDLKNYLKDTIEGIVSRQESDVTKLRVENEKLLAEIEILRPAQQELRKLKNMALVNPHWKGRNYEIENDLCLKVEA